MERLFRTLCIPGIFRTLVYLEPEEYSETFLASIMQCFAKHMYDEVFYLEPFVTLTYSDFWYIQNLNYWELKTFKTP